MQYIEVGKMTSISVFRGITIGKVPYPVRSALPGSLKLRLQLLVRYYRIRKVPKVKYYLIMYLIQILSLIPSYHFIIS